MKSRTADGGTAPKPLYAVALTRPGTHLAGRLVAAFPGTVAWAPERFAAEALGVTGFCEPVRDLLARLWSGAGGFFLVMAAGIAVRSVAPLLGDKIEDPAVIVLDPQGRFAVPLLAGHLGGANHLAQEIAARLGATAVLTTATDAAGAPAVELWARDNALRVTDRPGVVRVNAAWANGEAVGLYVDKALGRPELGVELDPHLAWRGDDADPSRAFTGTLIAVTHRATAADHAALVLAPPCLFLGVGCRRDADPEAVVAGVRAALAEAELAESAVAMVVSVAAKADEPALHELARALGVEFRTFSAAALAKVPVPTPSARVAEAVGTPSVAEAAAVWAAQGTLVLPKVKGSQWTAAVALGDWNAGWRES